ncbi:hypothetical protein V6N11_040109 [Hibiscus sabdariffa]|uniref:Uncharacterized protein n=1 Tax=Hibiscus sabdariffa TaxID=183260 RepID=A0ABR2RGX4_9ROSI
MLLIRLILPLNLTFDRFFFAVKEVSLLDQGSQGKQSIIQLEHVFHRERCDGSTPPIQTNVEEREFEHDIHNLLHDMMAERVMNNDERNNHSVDPSTRLGDQNHRLQGDKFYDLLKDAEPCPIAQLSQHPAACPTPHLAQFEFGNAC